MCGFSGLASLAPSSESTLREVAEKMCDCLSHRGPDDSSSWSDPAGGIALAFRRLSILDLTEAGRQPMVSADGRLTLAMNGEIYNHGKLRERLEKEGGALSWRGHSDTEVFLACLSRWGVRATLERANGMFAFALWDSVERALYLAIDKLGEKPLYHGMSGSDFVFGSELKALRQHPQWKGEINRSSLAEYFRAGYVPAPMSIYVGINKMAPGTFLRVGTSSDRLDVGEPETYWSAAEVVGRALTNPFTGSDAEAVQSLENLLSDAVRMRIEADVPVGCFLSGGIDSSLLCALMQRESTQRVRTFTIGFSVPGFNEADYAKDVALSLGTDHTEVYMDDQNLRDVVPLLPGIYDEPFADSSQIPTYLVSQMARRQVTVAIAGDGGDELFGGYNRYLWGARLLRERMIPQGLKKAVASAALRISAASWDKAYDIAAPLIPSRYRVMQAGESMHKLAAVLGVSDGKELYERLASHSPKYHGLVTGIEDYSQPKSVDAPTDPVDYMMFRDLTSYLPGDLLTKLDRASMAVSLEARVPFLDPRVVEFAWKLPMGFKLRNGRGKWILRQILARHIPSALFERPKAGFGIPLSAWLRGPLREWAEGLLSEDRLKQEGYLNAEVVRTLWSQHLAGATVHQSILWDILMFQAWLETQ